MISFERNKRKITKSYLLDTLQVARIKCNVTNSLWKTQHLSENQLVFHHIITYSMPLKMLQFGQQEQLRNKGRKKKALTLIKLLEYLHSSHPIFNNIWQNEFTIIFKNTINFFF